MKKWHTGFKWEGMIRDVHVGEQKKKNYISPARESTESTNPRHVIPDVHMGWGEEEIYICSSRLGLIKHKAPDTSWTPESTEYTEAAT
jgi:hypothetical protein